MHDLRTILQSDIAAKQQELYIDTQNVHDENIFTDRLRLNQVLLNIASNAIKFTPGGGIISIRITEKKSPKEGHAVYEFRIKDTGIGMSKEFQKHIFESFSREKTSTVSGIQGTGLGMAITKNILDMMGGTIEVISEEGKGSEFIVNLTCRLSDEKVIYKALTELEGHRALVVDDNTDTCLSVCKMLREIGMRPDWTTSSKESVIRAKDACDQSDEYKAYIIDWQLPDLNGIEAVRRIRRVIGQKVPIIILTAYDWSAIEAEAREAGVTAFVSKPLFMSELREALSHSAERVENKTTENKLSDLKGRKILLVEDNELNQEIAVEVLSESGFVVSVVNDGDIAVDTMSKAADGQYDLILMDIQMPKMDGYMATRQIRTLSKQYAANIPIIAMTANAFEEDRKKALESGMNGFVSKPINVSELMKAIIEVL